MLLAIAAAAFTCPSYTCLDSNATANYTCNTYINGTYYLKACPQGESCVSTNETYVCDKAGINAVFPGSRCDDYNVCLMSCIDGICIGKAEGEVCRQTIDCNPGLFCSQKACTKLLKEGESGCNADSDCEYGNACTATNKCVPVFSLPDNSIVKCSNSWSSACSSNYCIGSYCITPVLDNTLAPINCTSIEDCLEYSYLLFNYLGCDCKYDNSGSMACITANNKWPYTKLFELRRTWLLREEVKKCNSAAVLQVDCVQEHGPTQLAQEYTYYHALAPLYHKLYGAEDCVVQYFVAPMASDDDDNSGGSLIGAAGIVVALSYFA